MSQLVHGHEVMRILGESESPMSCEKLEEQVAARFGDDVRFHTCSADGMTLDELLDFLKAREKVVEVNGMLASDLAKICSHE